MSLILELVTSGAAQSVPASRKVFSAAGGTIGRAKHSDWVLPDAKVSARHARVSCVNGVFYIEDTSTNGVFLNSPNTRLVRGQPHALQAGDRLLIEPYEIHVSTTRDTDDTIGPSGSPARVDAPAAPFDGDPFASDLPVPALHPAASPAPPPGHGSFDPIAEPHADDELDPLKLLGPVPPAPTPRKGHGAADLSQGSPLDAHYGPPAIVPPPPPSATLPKERPEPSPAFIPENYDPLAPETFSGLAPVVPAPLPQREPPPTPPPFDAPPPPETGGESAVPARVAAGGGADDPASRVSPPRAEPSAHGDLAAVLAAAGLDGVPVTPELAAKFGEILRVVVIGVMDVLRSRNQIKDEFRMRMTHFRPADNNPLKFSANVDDALHNLLVKRNEAYLGPVEAFQDAFDDLRDHQLAMLAGMRVAFEFTLAEFDPDRLQEQFDQQAKKGSVFAVGTKLRYWDLFRERRHEIARDPEASFRSLFGEAFSQAYEGQMKRLKDEHRRT